MSRALVDRIADAVLYEGYVLYPYRASTVKNRQRFTFGGVYPKTYIEANPGGDRWWVGCQCLVTGGSDTQLRVRMRCLQSINRRVGELSAALEAWPDQEPTFRPVPFLTVGAQSHTAWQEAVERDFEFPTRTLADVLAGPIEVPLRLAEGRAVEPISDESQRIVGVFVREHHAVEGMLSLTAESLGENLTRISIRIENTTPLPEGDLHREEIMLRTLLSAHVILNVEGGSFVSLLDPPADQKAETDAIHQEGLWPVLVGEEGETDTLLCSPIILYDYPQIAPESPGDLFDGTEIDEILTLRIMTLTDAEKQEVLGVDARARQLLERTEGLTSDQLMKLHGKMSPSAGQSAPPEPADDFPDWRAERPGHDYARVDGQEFRVGQKVRLHPKAKSDVMDIAMDGQVAFIETIEQDFEGRFYFTVTLEIDPGRDLGMAALPGHRFFFFPNEVEPLSDA